MLARGRGLSGVPDCSTDLFHRKAMRTRRAGGGEGRVEVEIERRGGRCNSARSPHVTHPSP